MKPGIGLRFRSRAAWFVHLKSKGFEVESGVFSSALKKNAYVHFDFPTSDKLVLLAHGTGNDSIFTFQDLIEALLVAGYSVFTLDLPGHGQESSTVLTEESFVSASKDLKAYLHTRKLDSRKLFGIGYSLGGAFWLLASENAILNFEKMVLLAVPLRAQLSWKFFLTESLSLLSPTFYRQWRRYGWRETIPAFGNFRRQDFPLRLSPSENLSYPAFVDKILNLWPPLQSVARSSQNCLLILGRYDALAKPEDSGRWREANPLLNVLVVDRANHFLLPFQKSTITSLIHWMKS